MDIGETLADPTQGAGWRVCGRLIEWLNGQTNLDDRFSRFSIQQYRIVYVNRAWAQDAVAWAPDRLPQASLPLRWTRSLGGFGSL
jgi:hypothetical protein